MGKRVIARSIASVIAILLVGPPLQAGEVPVNADVLAAMKLPIPDDSSEKDYLGLTRSGDFTLQHIKADKVIIEVLSMYCPICQGEAPKVNKLHKMIQQDPKLSGRVKLIGVGVGNTPLEVGIFKNRYKVTFPIFPDDDFGIQKGFQHPIRTPTFVVVTINRGKEFTIVHALEGKFESAEKFLESIMADLAAK